MKTIVWHMNHRGFFLDAENIDIRVFHGMLEEIVGNIGDVVLTEVYKNLKNSVGKDVEGTDHKHHEAFSGGSPSSVIEHIELIMQVDNGGKSA